MELGEHQALQTADYNFKHLPLVPEFSTFQPWRKREADMVLMAAMYVDSGLRASPDQLDFVTLYESGKGSYMVLPRKAVGTEIDLALFLPGFITILVMVACLVLAGLCSQTIVRNIRSEHALGLLVAEEARFARKDNCHLQGKPLFLTRRADS